MATLEAICMKCQILFSGKKIFQYVVCWKFYPGSSGRMLGQIVAADILNFFIIIIIIFQRK